MRQTIKRTVVEYWMQKKSKSRKLCSPRQIVQNRCDKLSLSVQIITILHKLRSSSNAFLNLTIVLGQCDSTLSVQNCWLVGLEFWDLISKTKNENPRTNPYIHTVYNLNMSKSQLKKYIYLREQCMWYQNVDIPVCIRRGANHSQNYANKSSFIPNTQWFKTNNLQVIHNWNVSC